MTIHILGRQPALGLAELEAVFGADKVELIDPQIAVVNEDIEKVSKYDLGGTIKIAEHLNTFDVTEWKLVSGKMIRTFARNAKNSPFASKKTNFGFSVFGFDITTKDIERTGLSFKKQLKEVGVNSRLVPNKELSLNSAQTIHNKLFQPNNFELVVVRSKNQTLVGGIRKVQDIDAYTLIDRGRPKRDAKVGMLPPKLAQIIINFSRAKPDQTVWDPFCGTGLLLLEAMCMKLNVLGSDIDPRMIEYSKKNIDWLIEEFEWSNDKIMKFKLEVADATKFKPQESYDVIATEAYLGRPFSAAPAPEVLKEVIHDVNTILRKFLQNVASQTKPGFRMCIAVPAWKIKDSFKHLPLVDELEEIGYNRASFVHAANKDLVYHRPDQIVARELLVLTRK